MTINLENVRDDEPAIFNTIRQVVCNQSVYAPDVELALCMSPYLYRRLKEAVPMNAGNPSQLYGLPVYVFKSLPPELFYLVPEYVAQAWTKAEQGLLRELFDGPPRASAPYRGGGGVSEINKLAAMLTERGILFEQRPLFDGEQILVPGEWDAVCHRYSYGGPEGLLEVMGDPVTLPGEGAVAGWLTAADVIRRLEANAGGTSPSPTDPIIPGREG